jgi:hypothetical protein
LCLCVHLKFQCLCNCHAPRKHSSWKIILHSPDQVWIRQNFMPIKFMPMSHQAKFLCRLWSKAATSCWQDVLAWQQISNRAATVIAATGKIAVQRSSPWQFYQGIPLAPVTLMSQIEWKNTIYSGLYIVLVELTKFN